jgi:NADH-quinone oxidoreductase subunit N
MVFGLVFLVAGLAFKLGAVPFHMWVPDVYDGSPTAVTLLLGGAPKIATFAICIRLLVEGLLPLAFDWQQMLLVLAVLSLAIGNITAIAQTNIKRMLAYSTIAQIGFVLLGLLSGVAGTTDRTGIAAAYSGAMYYVITYVLTTVGTFGTLMLLSRAGFEADNISDFKGLSKRSGWFAGDDHPAVLAGRRAADDGLCRQVRGAELGAGHRPDLADRVCRDVLADRRVLLPARHQAHLVR